MADYEKIIRACVEPLMENPSSLLVRREETDEEVEKARDLHFLIACPDAELGRLIGRHGTVADAIRTIVNVKGRDDRKRVHIRFESFEEENEKEEDKK